MSDAMKTLFANPNDKISPERRAAPARIAQR